MLHLPVKPNTNTRHESDKMEIMIALNGKVAASPRQFKPASSAHVLFSPDAECGIDGAQPARDPVEAEDPFPRVSFSRNENELRSPFRYGPR